MASPEEQGRIILDGAKMSLTLRRLCHQLYEQHGDFSESCLIGLQRTGVPMMNRIRHGIQALVPASNILCGKLDVTFYRDDVRQGKTLASHPTDMPFLVENKRVILVDDVLYTGRTIRAALDALLHYGRPKQVELLTLIDRRFTRHLPIQADYIGMTIDAVNNAYVSVEWGEVPQDDKVFLFSK